jgi:hypothetical protein
VGNESSKIQVEIPKLSIRASQMELISFLSELRWCSATTMCWTTDTVL